MTLAIKSHVQLPQMQLRKLSRDPPLSSVSQHENVEAKFIGTGIPLGGSRTKLFLKERVLRCRLHLLTRRQEGLTQIFRNEELIVLCKILVFSWIPDDQLVWTAPIELETPHSA